jgi:hypothetical protein
VRTTYEKHAEEDFITSFRRLRELLSEKNILRLVCDWLGIKRSQKAGGGGGSGDRGIPACVLAEQILAEYPFAKDAARALYYYDSGTYCPYGDDLVRRCVKEIHQKQGIPDEWASLAAEETIKYIEADCPKLWDEPPAGILNCLSGLLDVRTSLISPHTPEYLSLVRIPVRFDPAAKCPAIEKFFGQVLPEDTVDVAYELAYWLIEFERYIQAAVMLQGEGSNGKSTFLEVLRRFIGCANTSSVTGITIRPADAPSGTDGYGGPDDRVMALKWR